MIAKHVMNGDDQKSSSEDTVSGSDDDDNDSDPLASISSFPKSSQAVVTPCESDVLCGRGKSLSHPGNQRFRALIMARKEEYQKAKRRDDKTRITYEIVEAIRRGPEGSRFLLKDPKTGLWHDVGEIYAREKVSHALRSRPNEERRRKPKLKAKSSRKPKIPAELEGQVQAIIQEQQRLLKEMIDKEVLTGSHLGFQSDAAKES